MKKVLVAGLSVLVLSACGSGEGHKVGVDQISSTVASSPVSVAPSSVETTEASVSHSQTSIAPTRVVESTSVSRGLQRTSVASPTSFVTTPSHTSVVKPKNTTVPTSTAVNTPTATRTTSQTVIPTTSIVKPTATVLPTSIPQVSRSSVRSSISSTSTYSVSPKVINSSTATRKTTVSTTPPVVSNSSRWDAIAACESGGNPRIVSSNGLYGGLYQIARTTTWPAYGGTAYAPYPEMATPAQQLAIAQKIQASQGWNAWPVCSHH